MFPDSAAFFFGVSYLTCPTVSCNFVVFEKFTRAYLRQLHLDHVITFTHKTPYGIEYGYVEILLLSFSK